MPTPWPGENTISTGGFLLCYSVSFMCCICIKIRSIHLLIELLRSPRNFDSILGLYRTGKLHLSQGVSGGTIHPFHLLSRDRSCSPRSDDCCENYANCALFCLKCMSSGCGRFEFYCPLFIYPFQIQDNSNHASFG